MGTEWILCEGQSTTDSCLILGETHALTRGIMFRWKSKRKLSIAVLRTKQIWCGFIFLLKYLPTLSINPTDWQQRFPGPYLPCIGTCELYSNAVYFSSVACQRIVWKNKLIIVIKTKVRLIPVSYQPTQPQTK